MGVLRFLLSVVLVLVFLTGTALSKTSLIVVIGGSGEEFRCDSLREDNRRALLESLNGRFLRRKHVSDAYVVLYSERVKVFKHIRKNRRLPDLRKYSLMARELRRAINRAYQLELPKFYSYVTADGKEVTYYRDVAGMLRSLVKLVKEEGLIKKGRDKVYIFIASDMLQTLYLGSKERMKQELLRNPIVFPGNGRVLITVLGKVAECGNFSESQLEKLRDSLRDFWTKVIKGAEINYKFTY